MKSCVFFGHRQYDYHGYKEELQQMLRFLIRVCGVTQFYAGGRGAFDGFCASAVHELKTEFPQIRMTLVYSYIPIKAEDHTLPVFYDDSVYLLDEPVPPRFAILKTNRKLVDISDYILSGVAYSWGGARTAVDYAQKKKADRVIPFYDYVIAPAAPRITELQALLAGQKQSD